MDDDDLVARIQTLLVAAQRRYRQQRGFGALVTPAIPDRMLDEVARGLAPVLRDLVREAVAARVPAAVPATWDSRIGGNVLDR